MSVDSNALNLIDYALLSNDPLIQEVAMCMIDAGSAFQDIPVITKKSLKVTGGRLDKNLPTINWAKLNSEPVVVKTNPKHYEESFFFFRNAVQLDEYLQEDENAIDDPVDFQVKAILASLAYELNDALINNTHRNVTARNRAANEDCFVGIRERLDNDVYGMRSSDTKVSANAVDLSDSGITGATCNRVIRLMQSVLDAMGNSMGEQMVIYMNDDLLTRLEYGIRALGAGGGFDMTRDAFDRDVRMYRNAKLVPIGRKAPSATGAQDYIISSIESLDGEQEATGNVHTSMYFAKWGMKSAYGWQFAPPRVTPEYALDSEVIKQVVIKGGYGLNVPDTRAFGRLYGIKVA